MKRIVIVGCALLLLVGLTACGAEEPVKEPDQVDQREPASGQEEPETEEVQEEPVQIDPSNTGADVAERKDIPVFVEGETEMRPAKLHQSELGYSIYVLDDYTFTAEEPNRDVVFSQTDDLFFARIISNGKEANAQELKQLIIDHAEGKITEGISVPLKDVEYSILEEVTSNEEITSVIHTAKKYGKELISFTVFLPHKEAAEGIGPSLWAMIDTLSYK
ncbi:hypothetical protein GN156_16440 [bacterium LRH843]|nr:hypothetical protein [bacterium LRH843]